METLDTRDLNERLEELSALRDALNEAREAREELGTNPASTRKEIDEANDAVERAEAYFMEAEANELAELESLRDEIREWKFGTTLIPKADFIDYCQELLQDVGDLPKDLPSYLVIDWNATADNIRADYSSVTYRGTDYLYRE